MKDGYIKLTTADFDIELPLAVVDPSQTIADCEQRFNMTSDDFVNTDKASSIKRTMENTFYFIMWRAALNQRAGGGWRPFASGLIGTAIKVKRSTTALYERRRAAVTPAAIEARRLSVLETASLRTLPLEKDDDND